MENCTCKTFCYLANLRQKIDAAKKTSAMFVKFQDTGKENFVVSTFIQVGLNQVQVYNFVVVQAYSSSFTCLINLEIPAHSKYLWADEVKSLLLSKSITEGMRIIGLSLFWLLHKGITHNV